MLKIMPKTTSRKKWLKRIVFGGLVKMPGEITAETSQYIEPTMISSSKADREHKVIYCGATPEEWTLYSTGQACSAKKSYRPG
jgi:hypothetical protein